MIEGSIDVDLLFTVNYWKARGKTLVVDIPLSAELELNQYLAYKDVSFSLSNLYANLSNNTVNSVTAWDKFKWGVHLAHAVLVSSPSQFDHWQSTAPVKVIQEFINLDDLRDLSKTRNTKSVIGLFTAGSAVAEDFEKISQKLESLNGVFEWMHLNPRSENSKNDFSSGLNSSYPVSLKWPNPLSLISYAVFLNYQNPIPGLYRNALELMTLKLPWLSGPVIMDPSISKYGLITSDYQELYERLERAITSGKLDYPSILDEAYFYAIGNNIDDHIHHVLNVFSEIQKSTNY